MASAEEEGVSFCIFSVKIYYFSKLLFVITKGGRGKRGRGSRGRGKKCQSSDEENSLNETIEAKTEIRANDKESSICQNESTDIEQQNIVPPPRKNSFIAIFMIF